MKIIALLLAILMLFGCTATEPVQSDNISESSQSISRPEEEEEPVPEKEPEPEPVKTEIEFIKPEGLTAEETLSLYFETLYGSYLEMLPVDIGPIIDQNYDMMGNLQNWTNLLALRRKVIDENGFCYVEKEKFPYEINYITKKDLDDQRMNYVRLKDYGEDAVILHFVIKGEAGKAYPPIFAANSQHTVIMTAENGEYKVAYHYFPGSEGKFENDLPVALLTEDEMYSLLVKEFMYISDPTPSELKNSRIYNGKAAAEYALTYCEERNPAFHFVGDWYGNCMNFASQCVWSGFKTEKETPRNYGGMTREWYCGKGGGTLVWSSVSRFKAWTEKKKCPMETVTFYSVREAKIGDIVNIGSYACETKDKYTHALIVVDEEKLILAQNSPACFVYYSDLANNYARFIRPLFLDS